MPADVPADSVPVLVTGATVVAAVADPRRFHRVELELASEHLSMAEIADVISRVLGTRIPAPDMTEEEAFAAGMPAVGANHAWLNVAPQPARPRFARDLGIPLTPFEDWARAHLRAEVGA
ncbi:NmrA family NAD(P)-binding protein [Streptomyces sp. PT12]|uniref:NmrA family NAD(P)-binding protein n=1 Tax=Streptomyces sp. PT12 TaxID=1510197 RepID=UPI0015EE46E0